MTMKIASWNVNSLRVRLEHVLDWLGREAPDVLGLQETKLTDDKFPAAELEAIGYRCAFSGQRTYNGVALLSRAEIEDVVTDFDDFEDEQRRVLGARINDVRVFNLYVPNGQSVGSDKYRYKLDWLEALRGQLDRELAANDNVVVVGDFNIAPDDRDVHDPEAWHEKILCSTDERNALQRIFGLGFVDTYRLAEQADGQFSWWDYRAAAFRRNRGLRIDLILASARLGERCLRSAIDVAPRRLERPSDHAPVVAEFDLDS
jgi:exodeoxyribonuclease-3